MPNMLIDGREVVAEEGATILDAARKSGISIPTLCYHPALEPYGACRLCVVEVTARGRKRLVTSCNYAVGEGLEVSTNSDEVKVVRKILLELLLSRCPNVELIQNLAKEYGVEKPRFPVEDEDCILCGLCTRICEERMGVGAIGLMGRGIEQKVGTPFDKLSDVCRTCGACAFVCPTGAIKLEDITSNIPIPIPSEFDVGLRSRAPIYIPYQQAVPNTPVIDREHCIYFLTGKCRICETFCQAGAIDFDQEDEIIEVEVGAVILAPGFEEFDTAALSDYGYGRLNNVLTSIEFERILSAAGPFQGKLIRPSDKKAPQSIAWIQCVGSRDMRVGHNSYCSSVCCTYAIKEAVVAKEHSSIPIETSIFFMDMRTYGKGFERYYERAEKEHGVRFVRARVQNVIEEKDGSLIISYADEEGIKEERFDLVVLSVGLEPSPGSKELSRKFGLELNNHGFCKVEDFFPVTTSVDGVYAAGVFTGPRDIPETVMEASAAASEASALLNPARHSLTVEKQYPQERDVRGERPRIGVFICHCGINIGGVVDVPGVRDYASSLPYVTFVDNNLFTCSQDTQQRLKEVIKEHNLNRVVIASCSPRTHEPLFQETLREAGLNKYLFEMANIRDQCSWVHMNEPQKATDKAKDLVRFAVAKVALAYPLGEISLPINPAALVVGGGVSGMVSALGLAEQGFEVHLVEKADCLGGIANQVHHTLEGADVQVYLEDLRKRIGEEGLIHVYTGADILNVSGFMGNFTTRLMLRAEGEEREVQHGVAIIAAGAEVYRPTEYLYGQDPRVLTLLELEEEIQGRSSRLSSIQNLVIIQCVGSRNDERPYCSRICCSESIKCALKLKELNPEVNIYVLYRDIRTYGFKEDFYREARDKGVIFILYDPDSKPEVQLAKVNGSDTLKVVVTDPVLGEQLQIEADVLALATGIIPPSGGGELAKLFKVPLNEDGFFLEAHVKLRPVDFAVDGVFLCGMAHSPKLIDESITQAKAAVSRATMVLSRGSMTVGGTVSVVDRAKCTGCGVCQEVCPFKAIEVDAKDMVAVVNEALCKGCGVCASSCRSGALDVKGFSDEQILSAVQAL